MRRYRAVLVGPWPSTTDLRWEIQRRFLLFWWTFCGEILGKSPAEVASIVDEMNKV